MSSVLVGYGEISNHKFLADLRDGRTCKNRQ